MFNFLKAIFRSNNSETTFSKFSEKIERWHTVSSSSSRNVRIKVGDILEIVYYNKSYDIFTGHNNKNGNYLLYEGYDRHLTGSGRIHGCIVEKEKKDFKISMTNPKIIHQKSNLNKNKKELLNDKIQRTENIEKYHQRLEIICEKIFIFNKNYSQEIWIDNPLNELTIIRKKINYHPINENILSYLKYSKFTNKQLESIHKRVKVN